MMIKNDFLSMKQINQRRVIQFINKNKMLKSAFKYYLEYNTGCNNPYHNVNHTMAMMDILIDMDPEDDNLHTMLLAAIFHDMNHSAGKMDDIHNVDNSIDAYYSFCTKYPFYFDKNIEKIIRTTQFPYKEGDKLNYMQRKVREADNLVCFYDDFLTQVLLGLKEEMHVTDLNIMIQNELKFFENSWKNLELAYSKRCVNKYKDEIKEYLKEIKNVID
ncbi:MAG: phosphohydrolase [Wendovervirus sonii]|uniref:Phosphohydrolase n=1 Tax=phage Lak_Megaphage_Sonny TaxID=3109229 RepID=A0ABZ0Z2C3_9CAUD|nr:MAG: phosphohydrolase [phage Lak_Megaphage_Sonny]